MAQIPTAANHGTLNRLALFIYAIKQAGKISTPFHCYFLVNPNGSFLYVIYAFHNNSFGSRFVRSTTD